MTPEKQILFVNAQDTSRHTASANTAIYPNLGLLTLMSSLEQPAAETGLRLGYFDGTLYGNRVLENHIEENADEIFALCFSALTSNYGASVMMGSQAKKHNPTVVNIFGNDHFSALYKQIMQRQNNIDFGFYGNDVVEGFTNFVTDLRSGQAGDPTKYPGLVYKDKEGKIHKNREDFSEYGRLALVNYSLMDSFLPHQERYFGGQQQTYFFMRSRELKSQVVDIGRGCIKFAGPRLEEIPINACDFCGIIPGSKEIVSPEAERAWKIIRNAYEQGFNYLYVTADELPLTLWPMLRKMINSPPEWYNDLSDSEKPRLFGYARAEAFATHPERVDALINGLGFDHFFIGFDGLTETSLRVMNKQPVGLKGQSANLMEHNIKALEGMVNHDGLITAGIVVTHLGITPEILEENFKALSSFVEDNPTSFAALDFGPLCPIPGSQSFRYLTHPAYAEERAASFGLEVDRKYLESRKEYYRTNDEFDMDDLVYDFIKGCCPKITPELVDLYMQKITDLASKHGIVVGGGV